MAIRFLAFILLACSCWSQRGLQNPAWLASATKAASAPSSPSWTAEIAAFAETSSSTSVVVPTTSSAASGMCIVFYDCSASSARITGIVDESGNTYSEFTNIVVPGSVVIEAWTAPIVTPIGSAKNITITLAVGAFSNRRVVVHHVTGASQQDVGATNSMGFSSNVSCPITPSANSVIAGLLWNTIDTDNYTPGTFTTRRADYEPAGQTTWYFSTNAATSQSYDFGGTMDNARAGRQALFISVK